MTYPRPTSRLSSIQQCITSHSPTRHGPARKHLPRIHTVQAPAASARSGENGAWHTDDKPPARGGRECTQLVAGVRTRGVGRAILRYAQDPRVHRIPSASPARAFWITAHLNCEPASPLRRQPSSQRGRRGLWDMNGRPDHPWGPLARPCGLYVRGEAPCLLLFAIGWAWWMNTSMLVDEK